MNEFGKFVRFKRSNKRTAQLVVARTWATPNAPPWTKADSLEIEKVDSYFCYWDLAICARSFLAEALLILAHNGGILVVDEQADGAGRYGCHTFDETNPYDWAMLWESDGVVAGFFWEFLGRRLQNG